MPSDFYLIIDEHMFSQKKYPISIYLYLDYISK